MGSFSVWHLLLLLAVVLLVFAGGGKIPRLMKDMGQGITAFKKGVKDERSGRHEGSVSELTPGSGFMLDTT